MENVLNLLYKKFGTFNPVVIADYLGIEVRYVPFLDNPRGQYIKILDVPVVLLNEAMEDTNEKYFVLAHELYHALYHKNLVGYYNSNNRNRGSLEVEANKFAVRLLLNLFTEEMHSLPHNFQELTYFYGVPSEYDYLLEEW